MSPSRAEVAVATASACLALALAALGWRLRRPEDWLNLDLDKEWPR